MPLKTSSGIAKTLVHSSKSTVLIMKLLRPN